MKTFFGKVSGSVLGFVALAWFVCATSLSAGQPRSLDVAAESVTKTEIRHSMIGPRNTLVFYTFGDQQAVLVVTVDNTTMKFEVSATVYVFANGTDVESLGKWINNQHSDGLFADAPMPTATFKVAAESCETVSHRKLNRQEAYDNYAVEYKIADVKQDGVFELKGFTATTQVLVKAD